MIDAQKLLHSIEQYFNYPALNVNKVFKENFRMTKVTKLMQNSHISFTQFPLLLTPCFTVVHLLQLRNQQYITVKSTISSDLSFYH